ncbi:phosphate ABC transporter permease PstA [Parasedimentitalea marina]|uniref:Phosphate transport system permease protein PstA n=1 Tax=Parasedimentitalea marina TaxID=2483033 RepID=A0A3T0MZF9_9RHOB|nr:phosphate ABC transporter permease PstA [Parasedimentitalea marina]AZV77148.1 phosphate ABC transporter permease PstA [Parasedimentitalea marina]
MINFTNKAGFNLNRRHRAERRFQWAGRFAILISLAFLALMFFTILRDGTGVIRQTQIAVTVDLSVIDPQDLAGASYGKILKSGLRDRFPDVSKRKDKKKLYNLASPEAGFEIKRAVAENPNLVGGVHTLWLTASDDLDMLIKGRVDTKLSETRRRISDAEINWATDLQDSGQIRRVFNWGFFTSGDSREPEIAGILSAFVGSLLTLSVCFVLSFPIGIAAAIYLEEFTPKNRISDLIEVNINNLAAVPSIVFGLLGLAILLGYLGMPRSSPLVGGMVLALMTLPTIIIASRAALRAVPPSFKEAALALGATPVQAVFHHVLPVAMPGMLTGAIVGMAQALGETAPLLMIGMVAFIVDVPQSILEPATALPVQIFLWADAPERAFTEKTAAAIIVLLTFLIVMNMVAIVLRRKLEQRF